MRPFRGGAGAVGADQVEAGGRVAGDRELDPGAGVFLEGEDVGADRHHRQRRTVAAAIGEAAVLEPHAPLPERAGIGVER